MSKLLLATATLVIVLVTCAPALAQDQDPGGFRVFWRDGMRMETNDGRFQLRLGGRIQFDWTFWGDDSEIAAAVGGPIEDGTEFRRARIFVEGYVYERIEYKAQFDFAGGEVAFKDVYFGIRHDKYGFRLGHFKEPFGLETLTSSKYITFVERSLPGAFDAERNSGFMLHGALLDESLYYGAGVFRETGDDGIGRLPGRYNFTGRVAGTPINEDDGRRLVHLGAAVTLQNDDGAARAYTQRPEVHLAPRFISSGDLEIDSALAIDLETAVIHGPFSVQAEWRWSPIDAPGSGDPTFWGAYAFASWFLTGESRVYDEGAFDRLHPARNFLDGDGGLGAWEVALRYSVLDLTAEQADRSATPIVGSRLDNLTVGLNWYWNPMTLTRLNLVRSEIDEVGGIWAVLWRGQLEF
ncbi:MAG TPA: porin [Acidobacteriota bacterium]